MLVPVFLASSQKALGENSFEQFPLKTRNQIKWRYLYDEKVPRPPTYL